MKGNVISRPGRSQGLLYKQPRDSLINQLIQSVHQPFPTTALRHSDLELSKSQMASKSHQWFKSYSHFTEEVDFAYWLSFIGKGLRLQPTQKACFYLSLKTIQGRPR